MLFAEQSDRVVRRMGAKGFGEIGIADVKAAISNAIYHVTAWRLHGTPTTPDK